MVAKRRVSIIGSGNWGSTIAKIVGTNILNLQNFDSEVKMWVFEETIENEKLTEIINTRHENVKYLPGVRLPMNVVAEPEIERCTEGVDILIFILPHQFLAKACQKMKPFVKNGAYGCSLIKGLNETPGAGVSLLTDMIRSNLQIPCSVVMGANLAGEVAAEMFCEATVASSDKTRGEELKALFSTPYFRIAVITDEVGAELCGALKNIVAVGAGIAEGLGYGENTKAAVIRLGFMEMKKFIYEFFNDRNPKETTFLESCGIADLITTCYGGRNRKIGLALSKMDKSVTELEKELLGGQSAQGVLTAAEVNQMLVARGLESSFPIFTAVHKICQRKVPCTEFITQIREHPAHI